MNLRANNLSTPCLLIIFNRPDTTKYVFDEIRKAKPIKLFVAADGPRSNNNWDQHQCKLAQKVIENIDWDCELFTRFRESNLGCKNSPIDSINWFFSHVDSGIILEDDCVPSQSFFMFCEQLLRRFNDDHRIGMISGNNRYKIINEESYHFSRHGLIWGWATWKRAWIKNDLHMNLYKTLDIDNLFSNIFQSKRAIKYWKAVLNKAFNDEIDAWDYQWAFARYVNNLLTIRPNKNLVSNIGFGKNATHTKGKPTKNIIEKSELNFPLRHPKNVTVNKQLDLLLENFWISHDRVFKRLIHKFNAIYDQFICTSH